MSVKNKETKRGPFKKIANEIRNYYRENGEFITMAWAGLNPGSAQYAEVLSSRYAEVVEA